MLVSTWTSDNVLNTKESKMNTIYGKQALDEMVNNDVELPLEHGEQRKYSHRTCEQGEDTRQRLNVKRTDDGAYLWHCFNCGNSGYYHTREIESMHSRIATESEPTTPVYYKPKAVAYDDFFPEAIAWLAQYEFDEDLVGRYSITAYDDKVFLPVFDSSREGLTSQVGYQVRNFNNRTAKYRTYTTARMSHLHNYKSPLLIITEDLLSSYKAHEAGANTMCLLGTTPKESIAGVCAKYGYTHVVVWLDDDKAGHQGAWRLTRELSAGTVHVSAILNKQPKEIPMGNLEQSIKDLAHG